MFTDMVGFTVSAQANEAAALKLLRAQEKLVRSVLADHGGQEIKSTGDGFLVEFGSALRATECAIDIQRRVHERNAKSPAGRIELRIGIHLGDIERRRGDIFGDAVNVASRIGPCAAPGEVCISGPVFDQVRNKIPNPLEKLEPRGLKGLQIAVDIYRVVLPWNVSPTPPAAGPSRIAVLPLANISPDPRDEYFADGLTEELIGALSKVRGLRVIARTSVGQYKSTSKTVSQIAAELGVASVLEGSVRIAGRRLRITLQLIDPATQAHVWANTYDRELDDVFAVQTDIAKQVADALKVEIQREEDARLGARPTVRTDSYLAYLKGRTLLHGRSEEALRRAKEEFELAVSLDATNAAALSGLSDVIRLTGAIRRKSPLADWDEASRALAERAVALDPSLAEAHTSLGYSLWADYDYTGAETEFRLATSLSPSYPSAHLWYAELLIDQCRYDEALPQLSLAEEADPRSSIILAAHAFLFILLGRLNEARGRLDKLGEVEGRGLLYCDSWADYWIAEADYPQALRELERLAELDPGNPDSIVRAGMCYARMGQTQRARECLKELEGMSPGRRPDSGIAGVYACLDELDPCFVWLERGAFENYDLNVGIWRASPLFEHVRGDPRFEKLLRRMHLM